jgi:hypothetical protein
LQNKSHDIFNSLYHTATEHEKRLMRNYAENELGLI